MRAAIPLILIACSACGGPVSELHEMMKAGDALALPRPAPDHRVAYGPEALQFGELRLPGGKGPHPVVIVIHGGCWLAEYDLGHISSLADGLTDAGMATWSIEYRRVGDPGGGWPGTFQDVADAADHLVEMAPGFGLDLERVAALGHSAGGHLALWLAGRKWLDGGDLMRGDAPLPLNGVVSLAGIPDLAGYSSPDGCGASVPGLLGGDPVGLTDRVKRTSPIEMVPFGIPVALVVGEWDVIVPISQATKFADAARRRGDEVEIVEIAGAGHFELIDPKHEAFARINSTLERLLEPGWVE